MSKRKLEDDDDVFVDDAPARSTSKTGKHSRKTSDVIDNSRESELVRVEPSTPEPEKSKPPKSEVPAPDQGLNDTLDIKINILPERVLRRADRVDATPPNIVLEENRDYESTPPGITAAMPVSKTAERYNMSHQKRGICLVLNHEVFEAESLNREGSDIDVKRIDATFSKLGFDVVVRENLKHAEVLAEIQKLSQPENHVNNDCVCVFVLTHGQKDGYLSAWDACYTSDKIWKPFTADNCPTLAGKPKLFFFQACRGKKLDSGVRLMKRASDTDSLTTSYKIPTFADFLIAHSCAEGFFSWRNPEEGTWYVQSLCSVLDKFSESTDLLKMLTMTARKVATNYESYDDQRLEMHAQKQVPSLTSTLTRELYFTPK